MPAAGPPSIPLAAGSDLKANFTLGVAGDATLGQSIRHLSLGVTGTSSQGVLRPAGTTNAVSLRVFDPTPSVDSPASLTAPEDTRSASIRLTVPGETQYLRFTDIGGGTLTGGDGGGIVPGAFYREADLYGAGDAGHGLWFTPDPDVNSAAGGRFGFAVQASTSAAEAGLVGRAAPVDLTITAVNDAPTLTVPAALAGLGGSAGGVGVRPVQPRAGQRCRPGGGRVPGDGGRRRRAVRRPADHRPGRHLAVHPGRRRRRHGRPDRAGAGRRRRGRPVGRPDGRVGSGPAGGRGGRSGQRRGGRSGPG